MKISNTTKLFLDYSYKGDGKYYLLEQGSQNYRNTSFANFSKSNADCFEIVEQGNDAPRGGQTGNYVIVKFNQEFTRRFGWFFEAKKEAEQRAKQEEERRVILEKELTDKFRAYVKNHPEKLIEWQSELSKMNHKKGRLFKENRVARAVGNFDFWGKYRIFDEVVKNEAGS